MVETVEEHLLKFLMSLTEHMVPTKGVEQVTSVGHSVETEGWI